jgi:hypothetical protein
MRLDANRFLALFVAAALSGVALAGLTHPPAHSIAQVRAVGGEGAQFFVASSGSDSNPGTQTAPWQTLSNVNSHTFGAGDCVNLDGGDTFGDGTVGISSITLHCAKSYGTGQATINSGSVSCFQAVDVAPLTLSGNVECQGSGATANNADGILIVNDTVAQLGPIAVGWSVNGYGNAGIEVYAANAFGFSSVNISGAVTNVGGNATGMGVGVVTLSSSKTVTASFGTVTVSSSVSNVVGTPQSFSGSGIFVSGAKNVVIDGGASGAVVHDNGAFNATSDGPAGILVALVGSGGSCHITRYEVYNQKTANSDGEGIDADWSTQNCIIERNLVHDNQGACLFAYNFPNSPVRWDNNQFRSNICRNNGHGLQFGAANAALTHCYFYGNDVYERINNANAINELSATARTDCRFFGNVFNSVAPTGNNYVSVPTPSSIVLTGNIYIGNADYAWSGTHYTTFAAWQDATGQEKIGGFNVGYAAAASGCSASFKLSFNSGVTTC